MDEKDVDRSAYETERAGAALSDLVAESQNAAASIEEVFARTGAAIESALTSAARHGGDVFELMAQRILRTLADLAIEKIVGGPLATLLDGAFGGSPLGQRADGGPVLPGSAYLVGERGPELFVPASAGSVETAGAGSVSVHFHIAAGTDAETLRRSQGQIATMVARAVAHGRRRL